MFNSYDGGIRLEALVEHVCRCFAMSGDSVGGPRTIGVTADQLVILYSKRFGRSTIFYSVNICL